MAASPREGYSFATSQIAPVSRARKRDFQRNFSKFNNQAIIGGLLDKNL